MRAVILALAGLLALASASSDRKVVCYFGSWAVYRPGRGKFDIDKIDPHLCTHLVYTFVGLNEDGSVRILDPWADLPNDGGKDGFRRFNDLRLRNPGLKTMIGLGGWNEGEANAKYSRVMASSALRSNLVRNILNFLEEYDFDGFDLDWEYPGLSRPGGAPMDKDNLVLFLRELKEALEPKGLVLGAAVSASSEKAEMSYHVAELSKYLDFINLMEYDFHGTWEKNTGHNSPLYSASWESKESARVLNIHASIQYWLSHGAAPEKLILGIPFYARGFTLANPANNGLNALSRGGSHAGPYTRQKGTLGYNEICEHMDKWTVVFDEEQRVPYAYNGDQWISYDDECLLRVYVAKGEYMNKYGLGGMMVWSVETDDFRGVCGEKWPLLRAVNRAVHGTVGSGPAERPPSRPPMPRPPSQPSVKPRPKPSAPVGPQEPAHKPSAPSTGSGPIVCKTSFGYLPDPNDDTVFYQCSHGEPYLMHCPETLVWDPHYQRCDYKHDYVPRSSYWHRCTPYSGPLADEE
ncbi:probable chitinase 10 [Copidosoma floridanum]|uniref:probable chitinase 10 n=1 Tax=Copidosoma floridanum TaxID=29053 RepID=UPI0006C9BCFA|nr:probable chitinase 10 [Copidosoma floridanum]